MTIHGKGGAIVKPLMHTLAGSAFLLAVALVNQAWAEQVPGTPPSSPSNPAPKHNQPPAPPSQIDPGILKQPDHLPPPNPEAVVPPPVVDPKMAIDPEKALQDGPKRPSPPPTPPSR